MNIKNNKNRLKQFMVSQVAMWMSVHSLIPVLRETEAGRPLCVRGQPCQQSEFLDSKDCGIEKLVLKIKIHSYQVNFKRIP